MRKSVQVKSWAVYQMTILGQPGPSVVCTQGEWEALNTAQPGLHRLVRGDIANEGEAERLARGSSGDDKPRISRKKVIAEFLDAKPDVSLESDGSESGSEVREDDGPLLLPFSSGPQAISELTASDVPQDERMESA